MCGWTYWRTRKVLGSAPNFDMFDDFTHNLHEPATILKLKHRLLVATARLSKSLGVIIKVIHESPLQIRKTLR